jgi:hypothetical protein
MRNSWFALMKKDEQVRELSEGCGSPQCRKPANIQNNDMQQWHCSDFAFFKISHLNIKAITRNLG